MKKFYLTLVALFVSASIKVLAGDPPKTVDIQKLPDGTTITIDGKADEAIWAAATNHADFRLYPVEAAQDKGASDMAGYWKALWTTTGIYVLVGVTADDVSSDASVGADWEQDGIEIYFDMNTDNLRDGGGKGGNPAGGHYDFYAKTDATTTDHTVIVGYMGIGTGSDAALVKTGTTSVLETFITWENIKDKDGNVYTPSASVKIGFDICLVDNDNVADRTAEPSPRTRQYWSANGVIEPWAAADSIAIATLVTTPPTGIKYTTSNELNVYPTIAKTTLHFSKAVEGRIVNMVGQEVLKVKGTSANVSGLKQGSYILITNNKEYKRFVIR